MAALATGAAPTIGIEEEFFLVDRETGALRSAADVVIGTARARLGDRVHTELNQAQVECNTPICRSAGEAAAYVAQGRRELQAAAGLHGLSLLAVGAHPFADGRTQRLTSGPRYQRITEEMRVLSRERIICATQVHVFIPDGDELIAVMNAMRVYLPFLLALSASSPFFGGQLTGMASYRSVVQQTYPRTGIPERFSSMAQYTQLVAALTDSGTIDNAKMLWWDLRPHPFYGTLEIRICDMCSRVDEVVALAALCQALVVTLQRSLRTSQAGRQTQNEGHFGPVSQELLRANKWQAVRYGLDGQFIDPVTGEGMPMRTALGGVMDELDGVLRELDAGCAIKAAQRILAEGTSSERQQRAYERTGELGAVVASLAAETMQGTEVSSELELASSGRTR